MADLKNVVIKKVEQDVRIIARSSVGAKGEKGTRWYNADGVPDVNLGVNQDFYLDDLTKEYYEKLAGVWTLQGKLAGEDGIDGKDVHHSSRTSGDGAEGTTDTYTFWQDAAELIPVGTYTVYNGADGNGAGDMTKAVYDTNDNGIVDKSEALDDGTNTATATDVVNNATAINAKVEEAPVDGNQYARKDAGWEQVAATGDGDMTKAVYDPFDRNADVFNQDNMVDGTSNKNYSAAEQTKLLGIEDGATAELTDVEVKAKYEANANTNAYTNAEQSKVAVSIISENEGVANGILAYNIFSLTQAEYDAISTKKPNTIYLVEGTDEGGIVLPSTKTSTTGNQTFAEADFATIRESTDTSDVVFMIPDAPSNNALFSFKRGASAGNITVKNTTGDVIIATTNNQGITEAVLFGSVDGMYVPWRS